MSGAIRRLFRQAGRALTGRAAPVPKKSARRQDGETRGRQFRRLAKKIMRRHAADTGARPWLTDTLDWLNLWHHNDPAGEPDNGLRYIEPNHLSPRL